MRASLSTPAIAILGATLLACGADPVGSDASITDDASGSDTAGCEKYWTTMQAAGTEVSISNGELRLAADTLPAGCGDAMPGDPYRDPACAGPVRITQQPLIGDFEVGFEMTEFIPGGDGALVEVFAVSAEDPAKYMLYTHGSLAEDFMPVPDQTVFAGTQETCFRAVSATCNWPETPVQTEVTLSLSREGTTYGFNGGELVNIDLFRPDEELIVGVLLGSSSTVEIPLPTSATFAQFTVAVGGGGVVSDSFECDSLL